MKWVGRRKGGKENQHQLFPFPMLQGRLGVVCGSTANAIKKLINNKGKHTYTHKVWKKCETEWREIVVEEYRWGKKTRERLEETEGGQCSCQISLLFCPPIFLERDANVKEEMLPRPL